VLVLRLGASCLLVALYATGTPKTYLLQGLVVDEACSILGDLELAFLDLLAKLPEEGSLSACAVLLDARGCSRPRGTQHRGFVGRT
jgi:hypothetical protein